MSPFLGPLAVVAAVLAVGGILKWRDPEPGRPVLQALGLPASTGLVRLYGVAEVVAGAAALVTGGRPAGAALAVLYAGFTAVVIHLVRRGDAVPSCGCFGRLSARPSALHIAGNGLAALIAAAAAVADAPGMVALAGMPAGERAAMLALVALTTGLVVAVLTVLPDTLAATRRGPVAPTVRPFEITEVSW